MAWYYTKYIYTSPNKLINIWAHFASCAFPIWILIGVKAIVIQVLCFGIAYNKGIFDWRKNK
jgi:hypothetical protein